MIERKDKEKFLHQISRVIWMTGLSGAGKTTLALQLEKELFRRGYLCFILDGDNVRSGINRNLTFTEDDRTENIRRIAEISKLFLESGIIIINCFISPTDDIRQMAKTIIGKDDFIEVFVNSPFEICEKRDVKGLYTKARKGEIINFTGIDSPYDIPGNPDIEVQTYDQSVEESTLQILEYILPRIEYKSESGNTVNGVLMQKKPF
jgi:adenylylsulfate kinase